MNRSIVLLLPGVARISDFPVRPAVQILLHDRVHRLALVIAQLDLERFSDNVPILIGVKISLTPLPDDIERAAQLHHHVLILGRVLDDILADKFIGIVLGIALVNTDAPGR